MVFIINSKKYDTDKMNLLGIVYKFYRYDSLMLRSAFGENSGRKRKCTLYRSNKNNFLLVFKNEEGEQCGQAIEEEEAKNLLIEYDYKNYEKHFGEIEEA